MARVSLKNTEELKGLIKARFGTLDNASVVIGRGHCFVSKSIGAGNMLEAAYLLLCEKGGINPSKFLVSTPESIEGKGCEGLYDADIAQLKKMMEELSQRVAKVEKFQKAIRKCAEE